ncbi:MAG: hypothetical protein JWQ76_2231 [Ramlibacter sp.]|nr:hypothetical protein [Ramlibacter sp.]
MSDRSILQHITELVDEEHKLRSASAAPHQNDARLKQVEVELDQCWDLLRQRRARREFGQDPDNATPRDGGTVENYEG